MRVLHSIRATRLAIGRREAVYLTVWLAVALSMELTARGMTSTDLQDGFGVFVWFSLIAVTALDHARHPLRFVTALIRGVNRLGRRLPLGSVAVSIDLRGDPPIEQGLPRTSEVALLVSLVGVIGLGLVRHSLPVALREAVVDFSPTLWFSLLGSTWAVALFCTAVMLMQPCAALLRVLSASSLRARQSSVFLFLALLVWSSVILPTWIALVSTFGCLAVVVIYGASRKNARLTLIFEETDSECEPCSLDWTQYIAVRGIVSALASGCLILLMIGSSPLRAEAATSMLITDHLGRFFAWALCVGSGYLSVQVLRELASARVDDPGEPHRPKLLLTGVAAEDRAKREQQLSDLGLDLVFEEEFASECDVRVAWQGKTHDSTAEFVLDENWLEDFGYLRRLGREYQARCRIALRAGLERVFEAAVKEPSGSGYWLAPHLWYFEALKRDSEEPQGEFTGPHFREVLPIGSRRHLRRVLNALQIDLIFFEDGISFAHFDRVLDRLFELFDAEEAAPRVEEYHLAGMPGVLVVLHEHDFGTRLRTGSFPKPDYRFLGRARILHIFRDRKGDVSQIDVPQLSGGVPDLMPVLL